MPVDKSLFFYGSLYHKIFDPQLAVARQVAVDLVTPGSSVLDIACGTGQLCLALRQQKQCRVVGLDLSLRMLEFAREADPLQEVTFIHADATNLDLFGEQSFDYATMLMLMHELPRSQQAGVLKEALRVASKGIIIDAATPLPKNAGGIGIRFVEATFGRGHHQSFRDYLAGGGLPGTLEDSGLPLRVEHSSVFMQNCRQAVMVSTRRTAP